MRTSRQLAAVLASVLVAGLLGGLVAKEATTSPRLTSQTESMPVELSGGESWPALLGEHVTNHPTSTHRHETTPRTHRTETCTNETVTILKDAGFHGRNLREAWAIVMRESRGKNITPGDSGYNGADWTIFQLNEDTYSGEKWWNPQKLHNPQYAAQVAYKLSKGGRTWYAWGLDGQGQENASIYRNYGWTQQRVQDDIVKPYQHWYGKYPC